VFHSVHGTGFVRRYLTVPGAKDITNVEFLTNEEFDFTEKNSRELRVIRRLGVEVKRDRLVAMNDARDTKKETTEVIENTVEPEAKPAWPFPTKHLPPGIKPAATKPEQPKKVAFETVGIWRAFFHKDQLFAKVSKSNAISIHLASGAFVPAAILLDHSAPGTGKDLIRRFKKSDKVTLYMGEVL